MKQNRYVGLTDEQLDDLEQAARWVLADVEEERMDRTDIGPSIWETLTEEEKRARRGAAGNTIHDIYIPAIRDELNRQSILLSMIKDSAT